MQQDHHHLTELKTLTLLGLSFVGLVASCRSQEVGAFTDGRRPLEDQVGVIELRPGVADGGELEFVRVDCGQCPRISVTTQPGLSAASIMSALNDRLQVTGQALARSTASENGAQGVQSASLSYPVVRGGNETGFGYTESPYGLTGFIDWESGVFRFAWLLPEGYISNPLRIAEPISGAIDELEPGRTSIEVSIPKYSALENFLSYLPGQYSLTVYGLSAGIPSSGASIFIDGCSFREATDPPSSRGLHPNWRRVSIPDQPAGQFHRATRPSNSRPALTTWKDGVPIDAEDVRSPRWFNHPELKAGYQAWRQPEGASAIQRPIVGLKPGDVLHASLLLRVERTDSVPASGRVDVLAFVGAPGMAEQIITDYLRERTLGNSPDLGARGLVRLRSFHSAMFPNEWVKVDSREVAPAGLVVPPGSDQVRLVVVASSLGEATLCLDWLSVEKMNCSAEMPPGFDP